VVSQVGIHPGDFVYADSAGAVVVPPAQLESVVEEALKVNEEDRNAIHTIADEEVFEGDRDRR
jgi:regulator of RNase E activity RraA